jgi:hypothetical protein
MLLLTFVRSTGNGLARPIGEGEAKAALKLRAEKEWAHAVQQERKRLVDQHVVTRNLRWVGLFATMLAVMLAGSAGVRLI